MTRVLRMHPRRRHCRGFTVVELLVASGITAVLAALLIGVAAGVMGSWNRSRGALTIANQAKLALDELESDIESAVFRNDGRVWMAATVQPNQTNAAGNSGANFARWTATSGGVTKPGAPLSLNLEGNDPTIPAELRRLEEFRFGMAGVWLRFFAVERDTNTTPQNASVPRALGYQIIRYRSGANLSTPIQYGLFRSWVHPDATFASGFSLFHVGSTFPTTAAAYNSAGGGGTSTDPGSPQSIRRPRMDYLIANHVVDFGVRIWGRDESGDLVVLFPTENANIGFAARKEPIDLTSPNVVPPNPAVGAPTVAQMTYGFPEELEVFLRILSDEGAAILEARERGQVAGVAWWDLVEANSTVYTRRIQIRGRLP